MLSLPASDRKIFESLFGLQWCSDIEKTHNIIFLISQCAVFDASFSKADPLNINAFAVKARYPDDTIMPEKEEAEQYYKLAEQVKEMVVERIN